MFEFLGRGKHKSDKTRRDSGPSTVLQTVQLSATQREMARLTLHGVLKLHGIPGHWISGEVIPVRMPGQGEAILLQLEIMHWHDTLVLHAPALQRELLQGLKRFDPLADRTRYLFSWKFSPDCHCPHTELPGPEFWNATAPIPLGPNAAATPTPTTSAKSTAETFEIPSPAADDDVDDDDHGFAPTQIRDTR
jgi:hypothetical protein